MDGNILTRGKGRKNCTVIIKKSCSWSQESLQQRAKDELHVEECVERASEERKK